MLPGVVELATPPRSRAITPASSIRPQRPLRRGRMPVTNRGPRSPTLPAARKQSRRQANIPRRWNYSRRDKARAARIRPTHQGAQTCRLHRPFDTTIVTRAWGGACVPDVGDNRTTLPRCTVECTRTMGPTAQFEPRIARSTKPTVWPRTSTGTLHGGPVETYIPTVAPLASFDPGVGLKRTTWPCGTARLATMVTAPRAQC